MATEILMPKLGLTMTEGTVESWLVKEGDQVKQGDEVCEISSEKLSASVEAPADGVILKIVVDEGGTMKCKQPIAYVGQEGESIDGGGAKAEVAEEAPASESLAGTEAEKAEAASTLAPEKPKRDPNERIFITPLARKMAEEKGYDIAEINGTGGNGRITRIDIERFVPSAKPAGQAAGVVAAAEPEYGAGLTGMRKTIAQRMMKSLHQKAQLTHQRKADITDLMAFRSEMKGKVKLPLDKGELSLNTIVTRAVVLALQDFPQVNAWYHDGKLEVQDEIHIGMATNLPDGLIVPVIKNADHMPLSKLGPAIKDVTSQARKGTLPGDLYSGSTFTITNLGSANVEYFTPIINSPEIGILGLGGIQKELAFNENHEVVERQKLPLSFTYDHQVLDGTPAQEFMNQIVAYLEDPYSLLF